MKLLHWFSLLLCVCVNAESNAMWRESGENVTLRCSSAGCSSSIEGYEGMYLYQNHTEQIEVFYCNTMAGVTEASGFKDRIQTAGSLKNLIVTISNLTVNDSGFYSCVFIKFQSPAVQCSVYPLFVKGVAECSRSTEAPCALADEKSPPLVLIIVAACTIGMLVTIIFILLIVPRVRRRTSSRRSTAGVPQQVSNDNVYEDMTKNGLHPLREQLPASPHDCA
ncbi:T-cell antigen CD7-like [Cebidichthys violaceus]|uniref:T-cell antigen CD7-like n=1 Tax=Cebidichthys violaceus TaxID=271503 RepID=UPI0035CC6F02